MNTNIIFASGNKLIGIDAVIPLFMELRKRFDNIELIILFFDKNHYESIRQNYHIWKALGILKTRNIFIRHKAKTASYVKLIRLVKIMAFKKNIILKRNDVIPGHSRFLRIIGKISSVKEFYVNLQGETDALYRYHTLLTAIRDHERRHRQKERNMTFAEYVRWVESALPDIRYDIKSIVGWIGNIKKRFKPVNIVAFVGDDARYRQLKADRHLWPALKKVDCRFHVCRSKNRIVAVFSLILTIMKMALGESILIMDQGVSDRQVRCILSLGTRTAALKIHASLNGDKLKGGLLTQLNRKMMSREIVREDTIALHYDYFLSAMDRRRILKIHHADVDERVFIRMGYNRRLPEWRRFAVKASEDFKRLHGDYFLYLLSNLHVSRTNYLHEPDQHELLEESLQVLRRYSSKIKTVFKPKTNTDMCLLETLLKNARYENFIIDYGHPAILADGAKFMMCNGESTVISDAYYLDTPVLMYTEYDPRFYESAGKQCAMGRECDFFVKRNPAQLDQVLAGLIVEEPKIVRDEEYRHKNFPATEGAVWRFWNRLLVSEGLFHYRDGDF